jgi:hypothetical protein
VSEPDKSRSLEEIENDYWGDPPSDATRLISTAHALRKRPVGALDAEGLRLLDPDETFDVLYARAAEFLGR